MLIWIIMAKREKLCIWIFHAVFRRILEVDGVLEAFSWENEVLGSLGIWRNDASLFQEEMIRADEIDENGCLKIQMEIETCEAESIEPSF